MKDIVTRARPLRHLHIRERGGQIAVGTRMLDSDTRLEKRHPAAIVPEDKKHGTAPRRFLASAYLVNAADFLCLRAARRRCNRDARAMSWRTYVRIPVGGHCGGQNNTSKDRASPRGTSLWV